VIVILLSRFAIHRESNPNMAGNILELLLARNDLMIQQIKHAIETNPDPAQKTVKTIADRFYISSKQVNSMFKQATGYSIKQYDIHHRMNLAKTLLQHSDQSIQDIADTLHFSTIHYFHRLFKKVTSLTPTQYRLQQQSSGSTTHHSLR
jgi:two-component system response regulator YesN